MARKLMYFVRMEMKSRESAPGEILDLLREFFNFLRLFHDGHRKRRSGIRLIDLVLKVRGHFIEFGDVCPESSLIGKFNGFGIGGAWILQARGSVGVAARGVNPGPRGGSRTWCLQTKESFCGKDAGDPKQSCQ